MQGTLLGNVIIGRPEVKFLSLRTQKSIMLQKEHGFYSHTALPCILTLPSVVQVLGLITETPQAPTPLLQTKVTHYP